MILGSFAQHIRAYFPPYHRNSHPSSKMGLSHPPAYDYSPINLTPSTATADESGIPMLEPTTSIEDREWNFRLLCEERREERRRIALRQAYIWSMTATICATIVGIVWIVRDM